jgi:hypothetical protein
MQLRNQNGLVREKVEQFQTGRGINRSSSTEDTRRMSDEYDEPAKKRTRRRNKPLSGVVVRQTSNTWKLIRPEIRRMYIFTLVLIISLSSVYYYWHTLGLSLNILCHPSLLPIRTYFGVISCHQKTSYSYFAILWKILNFFNFLY